MNAEVKGHRDRRLLAFLVLAFTLATQMVLFVVASRATRPGSIDLRTFYAAGVILRSGQATRLYNDAYEDGVQRAAAGPLRASLPFLYPPFAALLFVPLTAVSYTSAITAFRCVNLLVAGACACLLANTARLPRGSTWPVWALVLSFNPVCFTLLQGQVSLLLLLAVCACGHALERDRPIVAGLLMSLALVKFQLALPLALLFLLWRRWRVVSGFLLGATALLTVSALLVGGSGVAAYFASIGGMEHRVASGVADYSVFLTKMPNLYGLACLAFGRRPEAQTFTWLASVALLVWAATRRPSLSTAVPVALLVSYHMLCYDLSLLLFPLASAARAWRGRQHRLPGMTLPERLRSRAEAATALLLLLPPIYLVLEGKAWMPLLVLPMLALAVLPSMPQEKADPPLALACADLSTG